MAAVLLSDGRAVAVAIGDRQGAVWDLDTGELRHRLPNHLRSMLRSAAACLLPDGHSVAVVEDDYGAVLLWDLLEGRFLGSGPTLPERLSAGDVSATGMVLCHGFDITYLQWNDLSSLNHPTDASGRDL
ncbi:hypothetical protein ACU4GG_00130 [Streptomyces nojiriensis]